MSKYRATRTQVDGVWFASKREAARYSELKLLEQAGVIRAIELQPKFPLKVNEQLVCNYIADFSYVDEEGKRIIEDAKGFPTAVYKLKKKLLKAIYGIEVVEV